MTAHLSLLFPDNDLRDETASQREIQYLLCYLKCSKTNRCDSSGALICLGVRGGNSSFPTTRNVLTGSEPSFQWTQLVWFKKTSKYHRVATKDTQGTGGPPSNYWDLKGILDIWSLGLFLTIEQFEKQGWTDKYIHVCWYNITIFLTGQVVFSYLFWSLTLLSKIMSTWY